MAADPTVFVVDDDEAVRDSLTLLLDAAGFRVMAYESGRAFLERADLRSRGCVLLDVRMPDIGGLELQEQLTQAGVRLPVVIMTGHGDVPMAVSAMKAGAVDFVQKPFTEAAILDGVRRALEVAERRMRAETDTAMAAERLADLTPREREVMAGLVAGHPNKIIAHALNISPRTVEIHRARVMEKTRARSVSELVRLALAAGLDPEAGTQSS